MANTIRLTGYGLPPDPYIPKAGDVWENENGEQVKVLAVIDGHDVVAAAETLLSPALLADAREWLRGWTGHKCCDCANYRKADMQCPWCSIHELLVRAVKHGQEGSAKT